MVLSICTRSGDYSVTELMRIESADRKLGDKFGQSVSLQDDLLVRARGCQWHE